MDKSQEPGKGTLEGKQSDAQAAGRKSLTGEFYQPEQFNEPSGEKKKHHLHFPGHKSSSGEPHEQRKPSTGEFYQPEQFAYSSEHPSEHKHLHLPHKNKSGDGHEPRKPSTGEFYHPEQFDENGKQ
jgi:hypothetical protein